MPRITDVQKAYYEDANKLALAIATSINIISEKDYFV